MTPILKFSSPMSIVRESDAAVASPIAATDEHYVLPETIEVDAEAYADLEHHMKNPREPSAGLLAIFKR